MRRTPAMRASAHIQPDCRRAPIYCVTATPEAVELWSAAEKPGPMVSPYSDTVMPRWVVWHQARGLNPFAERTPSRRSGITGRLRAAVIARDGLVCQLCGGDTDMDDIHIDHIVPVKHGGKTVLENLQVAHSFCNMSKGARFPKGAA